MNSEWRMVKGFKIDEESTQIIRSIEQQKWWNNNNIYKQSDVDRMRGKACRKLANKFHLPFLWKEIIILIKYQIKRINILQQSFIIYCTRVVSQLTI